MRKDCYAHSETLGCRLENFDGKCECESSPTKNLEQLAEDYARKIGYGVEDLYQPFTWEQMEDAFKSGYRARDAELEKPMEFDEKAARQIANSYGCFNHVTNDEDVFVDGMKEQFNQDRLKMAQLQSQLEAKEREIADLKLNFDHLRNVKEDFKQHLYDCGPKIAALEFSLKSKDAEIAELKQTASIGYKKAMMELSRQIELHDELEAERAKNAELVAGLDGILSIGKRDMSNPKYDSVFETARELIAKYGGNNG